jgi:hypothetical protein
MPKHVKQKGLYYVHQIGDHSSPKSAYFVISFQTVTYKNLKDVN